MNVLMIEDNPSVCEMMAMFFEKEQFNAEFYYDGLEGLNAYRENPQKWDIILLDLNLPSMDGIQITREIRQMEDYVPIIMLTAQDSESDQVIGLEIGADDYVTKPFSPLTLLARMKAIYRRSQRTSGAETAEGTTYDIQTSLMKISTDAREAYYNGQRIDNLTPKEFDLLAMLASHPKRVFTRDELLTSLWEDPFYGDERTVDTHIKKLRQKTEQFGPPVIKTVWGVGYKYDESQDAS
ncbi:response regulator transcription factor [Dolosicoccus paucivorans]|uniref:DNA-binding response regulator n=1 Tax=Dolosicoccus paucivorans TaxID=84521 RepID=A0A1G8MS16_9LACT|nr:response regulator transcription factor [Dolosicoccus paucivorans]PMB84175.1 DNA-binding response regulator [Dolosicoccus paucivorans]PMC58425.1 DNA-binding response regulator [Dolosicoccus paucivorans]SDI70761.1 DNA-binding response regulator, OmpR family, contains REC and winged-helix (wHTH) domain [Dolosicoccus paucivorans]